MGRPQYETVHDLSREQEFATKLCERFNCELFKLPISYNIDFAATRNGEVVGWVETKVRSCSKAEFSSYIVSFSKYKSLCHYSTLSQVPAVLAIRWTDCDGIYTVGGNEKPLLKVGGRTRKTRDSADVEVVVHIPISLFKTL